MAVRSKEELLGILKGFQNEENEEAFIGLLEDISDTMDGLGSENAELRIKELEKALEEKESYWRKKYIDRFYSGKDEGDKEDKEGGEVSAEEIDKDGDGEISEEEVIEAWLEK